MDRAYYSATLSEFSRDEPRAILGQLVNASAHSVDQTQVDAWLFEIEQLKNSLAEIDGEIYFEYVIPRIGKRVDVILFAETTLFVIEYKLNSSNFPSPAVDQVVDYALDLKNFHETSHDLAIVPILVCTDAALYELSFLPYEHGDRVYRPIKTNGKNLREIIVTALKRTDECPSLTVDEWSSGRYCPTPSIIEAAMALYNGHSVAEISRSDAGGEDLHRTSDFVSRVIADAKENRYKTACFVTGVPGAGKTLIGLNTATRHFDREQDMYCVFLSGNGPLVKILQEALARDRVEREAAFGRKIKKGTARSEVKMFIQNIHHYRDECLRDPRPPIDHIALFDEAQRAWDLEQTSRFMRQKKGKSDFRKSEPEFLLSCIDRHEDWGVVVCLVGGGQEINTGEAGITEWIDALNRSFPDWHVHISDRLTDSEFGAGHAITALTGRPNVHFQSRLHLSVSRRSYRAENVSSLVKQILDLEVEAARETLNELSEMYPILLTRDLNHAKQWLRRQARGSERYGIVVSSQANRLKPLAIDVRLKPDPVHWFLADKDDVRSSYYLEDVSTEFDIQGLELDWVCITWDADFRYGNERWSHHSFRGKRWQNINKRERQTYLKNAYRVLLTRARQGMVICVPRGDPHDPTRLPEFYQPTYEYLHSIGLPEI